MFLNPRTLKSLDSIEKIQPRVRVSTFNGNPSTTIISCNSPTNVSDKTNINELFSLLRSIPKQNVQIIAGDMNAWIGKDEKNKFC